MAKTVAEINERIKSGNAVVVTGEEMVSIVRTEGAAKAAEKVDVVTTGTFGPMCSSGAYFNFGHATPRLKASKVWLNDVEAYAGLAAVDAYIGATQLAEGDPTNSRYPGDFVYGGGHVIHDLVAGKQVHLRAVGYGTDCYPNKEADTWITLEDLNEAVLFNPRNGYQNYSISVNHSDKPICTYMGQLKPKIGNAYYCSAGQLSPLLNDPFYRTLGLGTRIWLGGGEGYIVWQGTQHNPGVARDENGIPKGPAGTIAVMGDLKGMSPEWLAGVSFRGYGTSMSVGIGVAIPILDEDLARTTGLGDEDLRAPVIEYSDCYPNGKPQPYGSASYAQLKTGLIEVDGKQVPVSSLSSYPGAVKIATELKEKVQQGEFTLVEPVFTLPGPDSGVKFKPLPQRGPQGL
jgi:L-aspartate semialdehyde sulfurtransferase